MKANQNSKSTRKDMRIENELLDLVNTVRGDVPFAAWVKRAIIMRLENEGHVLTCTDTTARNSTSADAERSADSSTNKDRTSKPTTQEQREALIKECYDNGLDYKQTADWLNKNGYRPQRGSTFSPNSVRSIKARLSKLGKL